MNADLSLSFPFVKIKLDSILDGVTIQKRASKGFQKKKKIGPSLKVVDR